MMCARDTRAHVLKEAVIGCFSCGASRANAALVRTVAWRPFRCHVLSPVGVRLATRAGRCSARGFHVHKDVLLCSFAPRGRGVALATTSPVSQAEKSRFRDVTDTAAGTARVTSGGERAPAPRLVTLAASCGAENGVSEAGACAPRGRICRIHVLVHFFNKVSPNSAVDVMSAQRPRRKRKRNTGFSGNS